MKVKFLTGTKMIDVNGSAKGVQEIADYMFMPETIYKLKIASDMGLPVLTLVAKELEDRFDANSDFPLEVTASSKNAVYRQNVGRIVKFIMNELGYVPVDGGISERTRIPAMSKAQYFSTCAIYEKTKPENYEITVEIQGVNN